MEELKFNYKGIRMREFGNKSQEYFYSQDESLSLREIINKIDLINPSSEVIPYFKGDEPISKEYSKGLVKNKFNKIPTDITNKIILTDTTEREILNTIAYVYAAGFPENFTEKIEERYRLNDTLKKFIDEKSKTNQELNESNKKTFDTLNDFLNNVR